jgi:hypothetical protein
VDTLKFSTWAVGGELTVGRRDAAAPCPEKVEVRAIGPLGRRGDPSLDIRLDLSPEGFSASNCTRQNPALLPRGVQDDDLPGLRNIL